MLPEVGDVRPSHCSRCGTPSCLEGRILVQGHGVRTREVAVTPALRQQVREILECWERRYRCVLCHKIQVVLPEGVLPRFLYSIPAILVAWFLVTDGPIGGGCSQAEAYDRQGLFRDVRPLAELEPTYRWVSLGRWARQAESWWTGWTGRVTSWLALLLERSGDLGMEAAVDAGVRSHVRWGRTM
jgi:hypothetical protein